MGHAVFNNECCLFQVNKVLNDALPQVGKDRKKTRTPGDRNQEETQLPDFYHSVCVLFGSLFSKESHVSFVYFAAEGMAINPQM